MVRRYDADGRVLVEERSGPPLQTLAYRYDANGRLTRVEVLSPDGAERVEESYLYHDDQTSAVTLYIDPLLRDKNVGVCLGSMLHMSIDAVCITTVRDSRNRPIKKVLYDADNRVIRRVLFRYDRAGQLVEEGEVEYGDRLRADMRNLYGYDGQGHLLEKEMYWGAFGGQRKTMSYNEMGDLKEEQVVPLPGEVVLHEEIPWSTHYSYEYDTQGNWTSRTEQTRRLDSGLVTHPGVTKRTLKYWNPSGEVA